MSGTRFIFLKTSIVGNLILISIFLHCLLSNFDDYPKFIKEKQTNRERKICLFSELWKRTGLRRSVGLCKEDIHGPNLMIIKKDRTIIVICECQGGYLLQ